MTFVRNKSVKEWPEDERPRERLIAHGPAALSEAQLLAILIRNGKSGRTALDLGRELLERFESLAGIEQASITEICVVEGIGPAKAAEIKAAIELGRRYQKPSLAGASFCSSEDVVSYYRPRLKDAKKEIFRCALLDTKNKIIREEIVSMGSLTASIVHPRDTFKAAIRESAAAVIFIHNHPSGDSKPSQEDILLTRRLVQAGEVIGIQVLDHIIIGDNSHFSFRDNGLISRGA
ncbi:MAG: DNA repair protein RadC [Nitrospiraceae bacterium]|nr:DNA repair protein RadC [Nitrospiraceae bacterium]